MNNAGRLGMMAVAVTAAGLLLGPAGASAAATRHAPPVIERDAGIGAPRQLATLEYDITGLPPGSTVHVLYRSGVDSGAGGDARAVAGGIGVIEFADNAFQVSSTRGTPLDAELNDDLYVEGPEIKGTATIPAGVSVTVTNALTGREMDLHAGPFTMPLGVGRPGPSTPRQ